MKKRFTFVYEFLRGGRFSMYLCGYTKGKQEKNSSFFIIYLLYVLTQNKIECIL